MTTFIKFGGSVITDKRLSQTPDLPIIHALARAIATVQQHAPHQRIVLSHGSGSYGHVAAAQYGIHRGLGADADWYGFAVTAGAALRLNRIVVDALLDVHVPAFSLQPSTTVQTQAGAVVSWDTSHIERALEHHLMPVIHGDVAFDRTQGCSIASTERLLQWLCTVPALAPSRIILVGESAVYTADPHANPDAERIPLIHRNNIDTVIGGASGSYGIDVTGGMASKIRLMWSLISQNHALDVIFIRPDPTLLCDAILDAPLNEGSRMLWEPV